MKRTKISNNQQIEVLVSLFRNQLASSLGVSFGGKRDIYKILGYPNDIEYNAYYAKYIRQDIANAIINKPINATWRGDVWLVEKDDEELSQLEKGWRQLYIDFKLKSIFKRVDILTSLGGYSVLFLGFNDISNNELLKTPLREGAKLIYLKPYGRRAVTISKYDQNPFSPRFNKPLYYAISVNVGNTQKTVQVHYSRVIHITQFTIDNENEGAPVLEKVYNRLMDLEKIVGGSGEMFWKNARPGYQANVDSDYTLSESAKKALEAQIDEYEHELRRMLVNEGVKWEALTQNVADPLNSVLVQIQMISAATEIPMRILIGSERGELASSQDVETWLSLIQDRREEYINSYILRPFTDHLIEYGVLPETKEYYTFKWSDLFTKSDKDKAEIGKLRSQALKEYSSSGISTDLVSPLNFFQYFLGFDKITAEELASQIDNIPNEDDDLIEE